MDIYISVQFSHSVMCDFLWHHGLQHARPPCPSPTLGVFSNSRPFSQWLNHLFLCHPLLLLPSIFASIRIFSSESVLRIRWPKYWSFSFSPPNEYSGQISFRIDWLDLLVVQETLNARSKHILFTSECTGSNSLTTKIGEVPVTDSHTKWTFPSWHLYRLLIFIWLPEFTNGL